jgi:branched-chain amino acid transport system permease protein
MAATTTSPNKTKSFKHWLSEKRGLLITILILAALPFLTALVTGQSMSSLLANESGQSKFIQGMAIEIFILAVYAISYDLLLGITGLLSFGHAMFFGVGAYLTGIMLKFYGWPLWAIVLVVAVGGVVIALLFSVVLPRVKGITFALVTLGLAEVFTVVIQSRELVDYAGGEIGLQGATPPEWLSPVDQRLRFYFIALAFMFLVYFFYKRFVNSPTGRVCIAIRENENRAKMLGYNTFYFKLVALIISGITASLAGAMHAVFHPLIRPGISSVGFTISALLMVLFGGVGTLSGAIVGAALFKLLSFVFEFFIGEYAQVLIGIFYILIVIFLPYGIVGTWKLRSYDIKKGWERLLGLLSGKGKKIENTDLEN